MKNKFLNLMALVAVAFCFSTFTLAETKTNVPAENSASVNVFHTENAPPVTTAAATGLNDSVSVEATDRQNDTAVSNPMTDTGTDLITNLTNHELERLNPGDVSVWDYRLGDEPENFYVSTDRANNFRPPNETSPEVGQPAYKETLKLPFEAANTYKRRR